MIARLLSNLKWILLIAVVGGPGLAYFSYTELETIKRVDAEGVVVTAEVDGGQSSTRRSSTTYKIHAIWVDAANQQHAENVNISSEFAHKIVQDDVLMVDAVQLKYLPNDPKAPVFVADDLPQQQDDKQTMIWLGIAAGVIGVIGGAIYLLMSRRKAGS